MRVWMRLSCPSFAGETQIQVDSIVNWTIGGKIAVASSDYDMKQTEMFTIINSKAKFIFSCLITLDIIDLFTSKHSDNYGE